MPGEFLPPPRGPSSSWWLFDASLWSPRWAVGSWSPFDGWATITADLMIAIGYLVLPAIGWWMLRHKPSLWPDKRFGRLCLWFVLLCGLTHGMTAATFWWPAYRLHLVIKLTTALITWATVFKLLVVRRRMLRYGTPEEYETSLSESRAANVKLELLLETERSVRASLEGRCVSMKHDVDTAMAAGLTEESHRRLQRSIHGLRGDLQVLANRQHLAERMLAAAKNGVV